MPAISLPPHSIRKRSIIAQDEVDGVVRIKGKDARLEGFGKRSRSHTGFGRQAATLSPITERQLNRSIRPDSSP
jgi:hypothetical protein